MTNATLRTVISKARVCSVCGGISTATLYRWVANDPSFPKQVQLGPRRVGWYADEVAAWLGSRQRTHQSAVEIEVA